MLVQSHINSKFFVTLDTFEKISVFVETLVTFVFPKSRSLVSKCKIQNKTENQISVKHSNRV